MLHLPIYLDYNSTTPVDPRVLEAMLPYFTQKFGNAASRTHSFGWEGEEAVEIAREQVARLIGAEPKEIAFTSGATEGDNLALKGVFEAYSSKGNHIITVATEHKAVLDSCHHIEKLGGEVTYLPVDGDGLIDLAQLEASIRPATVLIAVMYANNEIGVLQPVREISAIARRHGILFFTDATQALGKVPIDVNADGIDILTCSAHKIYGPKGIGAIYTRRRNPRVRLTAQMDGGGHERGVRSGTLNVPAIVGLGKACEIAGEELRVGRDGKAPKAEPPAAPDTATAAPDTATAAPDTATVAPDSATVAPDTAKAALAAIATDATKSTVPSNAIKASATYTGTEANRIAAMRDKLEAGLLSIEGAKVNGSRQFRLPHTTNISFPGVDGQALLAALAKDIALSSGSACTSASMEPSYVLKALGIDDDLAHSSLRLGLGRFTTEEEINYAIDRISGTVLKLRERATL